MSWVILILVSIFTTFVNLIFLWGSTETSLSAIIFFNSIMLIGYMLMFVFYGSRRQRTLSAWLPIKSKITAILFRVLVIGICFAALPLAYKLSQATECSQFLVNGRGATLSWALSFICEITGPVVPAAIFIAVIVWAFPSLVKAIWKRT
jgi:hypothetical protein